MRELRYSVHLLALALFASPLFAQETSGLVACIDAAGKFVQAFPNDGQQQCDAETTAYLLGSVVDLQAGAGLTAEAKGGRAIVNVADGLAIPPACPAGQIALSDGQGGWMCTLPDSLATKNPASKLWVVPSVEVCRYEKEGRWRFVHECSDTLQYTNVGYINPGAYPADVYCFYFDTDGAFRSSFTQTQTVNPGAQGNCFTPDADAGTYPYAWMIVTSNQPVLPTAYSQHRRSSEDGIALHAAQVEVYPVDCSKPEGHEFVCLFKR